MANKSKNKQFQQNPKKLMNGFAAAFNEPTVNFPNSDTVGGASVLQDGPGLGTLQVKEPVYDYIPIKDPIISEVSVVPMSSGGGIIRNILSNNTLDTNMNPATEVQPPITPLQNTPVPTYTGVVQPNILKWVIAIVVVVGIIYFIKKK